MKAALVMCTIAAFGGLSFATFTYKKVTISGTPERNIRAEILEGVNPFKKNTNGKMQLCGYTTEEERNKAYAKLYHDGVILIISDRDGAIGGDKISKQVVLGDLEHCELGCDSNSEFFMSFPFEDLTPLSAP